MPHELWPHIKDYHIDKIQLWPAECFYYGCNHEAPNKLSLEYHLKDAHYRACRSNKSSQGVGIKRKRSKPSSSDLVLEGSSEEKGHKGSVSSTCSEPDEIVSVEIQSFTTDVTSPLSPDFQVEGFSRNSVSSPPNFDTTGSCKPHITSNNSSLSFVEVDDANIDPRLRTQDCRQGSNSPCETEYFEVLGSQNGNALIQNVSDVISMAEGGVRIDDIGPETPCSELRDEVPVEVLRARCQGWYLTKWVGWDDKYNEWRLREDLLSGNLKHVEEYDMAHEKNSFGTIVAKRSRKGVTEYRLKWNYLSMRNASWLLVDEVEDQLINEFEALEALKKTQPRRKKRKTQAQK